MSTSLKVNQEEMNFYLPSVNVTAFWPYRQANAAPWKIISFNFCFGDCIHKFRDMLIVDALAHDIKAHVDNHTVFEVKTVVSQETYYLMFTDGYMHVSLKNKIGAW